MIIVMGPGRCGTTFLARILNELGYSTGGHHEIFREKPLEIAEMGKKFPWPRVVKGTGALCKQLYEKSHEYEWNVEHIFYCYRKYDAMVRSHEKIKKGKGIYKGLTDEQLHDTLVEEIPNTLGLGLLQCAEFNCPTTLVKFPESALKPSYLHNRVCKLNPGILYGEVLEAHRKIYDPEKIRNETPNR